MKVLFLFLITTFSMEVFSNSKSTALSPINLKYRMNYRYDYQLQINNQFLVFEDRHNIYEKKIKVTKCNRSHIRFFKNNLERKLASLPRNNSQDKESIGISWNGRQAYLLRGNPFIGEFAALSENFTILSMTISRKCKGL